MFSAQNCHLKSPKASLCSHWRPQENSAQALRPYDSSHDDYVRLQPCQRCTGLRARIRRSGCSRICHTGRQILVGISNGIGSGVSSAIYCRIGAKDKFGADKVAMHALPIALVLSLVLTIPLYYFLEPFLKVLGAGSTIDLAMEYGRIIFAGTLLLIFEMITYSITPKIS